MPKESFKRFFAQDKAILGCKKCKCGEKSNLEIINFKWDYGDEVKWNLSDLSL